MASERSQATLEKYEAAKKLIQSGVTAEAATRQVGMAYSNFYTIRKRKGETVTRGTDTQKPKPVRAITIPESGNISFTPKEFAAFVRELLNG